MYNNAAAAAASAAAVGFSWTAECDQEFQPLLRFIIFYFCQYYPTTLLTLLEPQSRFGGKPLNFQLVCPQNGTAVLKGLILELYCCCCVPCVARVCTVCAMCPTRGVL